MVVVSIYPATHAQQRMLDKNIDFRTYVNETNHDVHGCVKFCNPNKLLANAKRILIRVDKALPGPLAPYPEANI